MNPIRSRKGKWAAMAVGASAAALGAMALTGSSVATAADPNCANVDAGTRTISINCKETVSGTGGGVQLKRCSNNVCQNVGPRVNLPAGEVATVGITGTGVANGGTAITPADEAQLGCVGTDKAVGLFINLAGGSLSNLDVTLKVGGTEVVQQEPLGQNVPAQSHAAGACVELPA